MDALIFIGGEAPCKKDFFRFLKKICPQKKYFTIAADSGISLSKKYKIPPDIFLGDMDSAKKRDIFRYKKITQQFSRDKDFSDAELALITAQKNCNGKKILLGGGGGRLDHIFSLERIFQKDFFPDFWITKSNFIFCLDSQNDARKFFFSKDFFCYSEKDFFSLSAAEKNPKLKIPEKFFVSIFPIFLHEKKYCQKYKLESRSLFWKTQNIFWEGGEASLSNRVIASEKFFELSAKSGRFLVVCGF